MIIGGYVEDQMWIKEAEHLKTMIKNNSLDVEVQFSWFVSFANIVQQLVQVLSLIFKSATVL